MKLILLGVLAFFDLALGAQSSRESERYTNAYKEFQSAAIPIPEDSIKNYVYFARDREALLNHPLLNNPRFEGAQIMYSWARLEPVKGHYDFSEVREDYQYLSRYGKKLFIQLQDATFDTNNTGIPKYLLSAEYDGGAIYQRLENGSPEGWVAKRWNKKVRQRFALLLTELGRDFDGKIEGINLQETSIGVSHEYDASFTPTAYAQAIQANMSALKKAFPHSASMQYANFMPGEWLPFDDEGYLRGIFGYGERIGVGIGAPDLLVKEKAQLNHVLALMHESDHRIPLGIAIQDGNYIGKTNTNVIVDERTNIVPLLHAFAKDFLKVTYIFWSNQEPYFEEDVLPAFGAR